MKKIGVLLYDCGVYDCAEIQEAVFTLLAFEEFGAEAVCIGINKNEHHVINHATGEEMLESINMMVEAARIACGKITSIEKIDPLDNDAMVIPGGFGAAKNFTDWAKTFAALPVGAIKTDFKPIGFKLFTKDPIKLVFPVPA